MELADDDDQQHTAVEPVQQPVQQPHVIFPMANSGRLSLQKFNGLSTDNANRFLADFESYSVLHQLAGPANDARKVAAFHLHLAGPALTWFNALPPDQKNNWDQVLQVFVAHYIGNAQNNPALLAEA